MKKYIITHWHRKTSFSLESLASFSSTPKTGSHIPGRSWTLSGNCATSMERCFRDGWL